MLNELQACPYSDAVLADATRDSFFGCSRKQGVSIRYALASCVPTERCGGRCYAHDGRDRELQHIFRGVLNYYVGLAFEQSPPLTRTAIMERLAHAIDTAVRAALDDQVRAAESGFSRQPRIRFSHVGEMAATPGFTNELARQVIRRNADIQCVIYTRHPRAKELDTAAMVVNFTLEGPQDSRRRFAPLGSRLVSSAWDGVAWEGADVNFLEHHVEKTAPQRGGGCVCPVTVDHKSTPSCDSARCEKCFERPKR